VSTHLDLHHLSVTQRHRVLDQSRSRFAEHHAAWWRRRLHSLRHPDLLADGGVTRRLGTDLARDHLAGIEPDAQLQRDAIARLHLCRQPLGLSLNPHRVRHARKAWSSKEIGAPNTAMIPSPVNWFTVPP
jgi:hypothetical protein